MSTRATRLAGAWLLVIFGCAAANGPQREDVAFVVDTPSPIGRIEFSSDTGSPFSIALVPAGVTIYELRLRPGRYCLEGLAAGDLNIGVVTTQRAVPCFDVAPGGEPYAGHILVDSGLQLSWAYDPARWRIDREDPAMPHISG